jgi:hypothetical protein
MFRVAPPSRVLEMTFVVTFVEVDVAYARKTGEFAI